jgi:ATP-dependent exoDNAse (exonuclease V) beta subunit
VLKGANPNHIVALTFTKKAANEMKERVLKTLEFLHEKKPECEQIAKLLGWSETEVLQKRDAILESFWQAPLHIETIDAFVGRILRKFSLHVGVMPDFSIESIPDNLSIQRLFLAKTKKASQMQNLIELSSAMRWRLVDLFGLFEQLYEKAGELENIFPKPKPHPNPDIVLDVAKEILNFLEKANAPKSAKGPFEPDTVRELLTKKFWEKESLNYWVYKKIYSPQLDELFEKLKNAYADYANQKEAFLLGQLQSAYERYLEARWEWIAKSGMMSFSDVTQLVYRLMRQEVDKEFLYFRLDAQIEHLLIDEFQDTNVAQIEILAPLIEEIISGVGVRSGRTFFYVGDVKQSIYRFRGGQEALFHETVRRFNVNVDALRINYRSAQAPVAFVNEIFANVLTHYQPQEPNSKELGYVHVSIHKEAKDGVLEALEGLLNGGVSGSDIAILTHTNDDASFLQEAIMESFPSLSVSTQSSKKLIDALSVQVLIAYLRYLYFKSPLDRACVAKLCGVSPLENPRALHKPFPKVVLEGIEILGLDSSDIELAAFMESVHNYKDIESFLFGLERFDVLSPQQYHDGVTLLTVHKSKGLEFEYVIVADKLGGDYHGSNALLFEYDGARLKNIFYTQKQREYVDRRYSQAKSKEQASRQQDRLNALYVAFTRAKTGLVIAKKEQKSVFETLEIDEQTRGQILPTKKRNEEPKKEAIKPILLPYLGKQNVEDGEEDSKEWWRAKRFGQMLHACIERCYEWNEAHVVDAFEKVRSINHFLLEVKDWEDIKNRLLRLSKDALFQKLINEGKVLHEQPLQYLGEKKQIDTMVIKEDEILIIDYKSGMKKEEHQTQVRSYQEAIEVIMGKKTQGWLIYLGKESIEAINL